MGEEKSKPTGCVTIIVAVAFLGYLLAVLPGYIEDYYAVPGAVEVTEPTPQHSDLWLSMTAEIKAERYVRGVLKSPSTAKFSPAPNVTKLSDGKYRIVSWVDSQNSFGATVRYEYSITISAIDGLWTCEVLYLNGKKYIEEN